MAQTNEIRDYVLEFINNYKFYSESLEGSGRRLPGFTNIFSDSRIENICETNENGITVFDETKKFCNLSRLYDVGSFPQAVKQMTITYQGNNGNLCHDFDIEMKDEIDMGRLAKTLKRNEYLGTKRLELKPELSKLFKNLRKYDWWEMIGRKSFFSKKYEILVFFSENNFGFTGSGSIKPRAREIKIMDDYIREIT